MYSICSTPFWIYIHKTNICAYCFVNKKKSDLTERSDFIKTKYLLNG